MLVQKDKKNKNIIPCPKQKKSTTLTWKKPGQLNIWVIFDFQQGVSARPSRIAETMAGVRSPPSRGFSVLSTWGTTDWRLGYCYGHTCEQPAFTAVNWSAVKKADLKRIKTGWSVPSWILGFLPLKNTQRNCSSPARDPETKPHFNPQKNCYTIITL